MSARPNRPGRMQRSSAAERGPSELSQDPRSETSERTESRRPQGQPTRVSLGQICRHVDGVYDLPSSSPISTIGGHSVSVNVKAEPAAQFLRSLREHLMTTLRSLKTSSRIGGEDDFGLPNERRYNLNRNVRSLTLRPGRDPFGDTVAVTFADSSSRSCRTDIHSVRVIGIATPRGHRVKEVPERVHTAEAQRPRSDHPASVLLLPSPRFVPGPDSQGFGHSQDQSPHTHTREPSGVTVS